MGFGYLKIPKVGKGACGHEVGEVLGTLEKDVDFVGVVRSYVGGPKTLNLLLKFTVRQFGTSWHAHFCCCR